MEKKLNINDNRVLYYVSSDESDAIQIRDITTNRGYINNNYSFKKDKNYEINAYTINNNITELMFEINSEHPLYQPFINLLGDKDIMIIDDDNTKENNKKYLMIKLINNNIVIQFVNNLTNNKNKFSYERFNIFIKDVHYNLNSKIDKKGLDTKNRLELFFEEVNNLIIKETIDYDKKYVKKRTS